MPTTADTLSNKLEAAAFKEAAIEHIAIEKLKPHPNNARTHDERQLTILAASMKEFGFINPVLVDEDTDLVMRVS